MRLAPIHGRWTVVPALAVALIATACGTDFASQPLPTATPSDPTPQPVATVYRSIPVTPIPTIALLPTPTLVPSLASETQKDFPEEIDPSRNTFPLPGDVVVGLWTEYLNNSHFVVELLNIDLHLCSDGSMSPGAGGTAVEQGFWGLRTTGNDELHQVTIGRQFSRNRLATIAVLWRSASGTIAMGDSTAPVFVTHSNECET